MTKEIVIIDDEPDICNLVKDILEDDGYNINVAHSSTEAFQVINKILPNVVILDIWLQGSELDGLGILEILVERYPHLPIIMISGHGTIDTALTSIKMGAYDYIEKPFSENKLLVTVKRAYEINKLLQENNQLRNKNYESSELIGVSNYITKLKSSLDKIAQNLSRILITGAPGVGKTFIAQLIHAKSKRKEEPFIIYQPIGKSADLIEKELFGYEKSDKNIFLPRNFGILEIANGGTLFIKNIDLLPINTQNRLLHFLQLPKIQPTIMLDVRIIASSSKNLIEEIKKGNFSNDLYYRICVTHIEVPTLSERKEDIPILVKHFLNYFYKTQGYSPIMLTESTIGALQTYSWQGNIDQLKNVLESLLISYSHEPNKEITPSMLPPDVLENKTSKLNLISNPELISMPLKEAREMFESQYLSTQFGRFGGSVTKMSKVVGMERSALHRKLKSLEIVTQDEK